MTARPPRWRRTLRRMALALPLAALAAALAAAGYAWQWWLQVQQEQGIVGLDWHGLQVSRHGLRLERLELQQLAADGRRLQLAADTVQLDWRLQRTASYLERLHVAHLQLDWQAPAAPGGEASRLPSADALAGLLAWLPRELQVQRIDARLPCPAAPCRLRGSLALQQPGAVLLPASLRLDLEEGEHRLRLAGSLDGRADDARLQLALELDGQPHLALAARLGDAAGQRSLQGSLQLPPRPPAPWLRQWLASMFGAAAEPLARLPDDLQLDADWTLQLPAGWRPQDGLPAAANLQQARLQARLPRLRLESFELHEVRADLALAGQWQEEALQLEFAADAHLAARRLSGADGLRLDAPRLGLAGLQLRREADGSVQLAGPLSLHGARLQQAALQPQGWRWQGRVEANAQALRLDGRLDNDAGLVLDLQLQRPADGSLALRGRLAELDLAAGNPLAATLAAWPAPLELTSGHLAAHADLQLPAGKAAPRGELELQLKAVGGILERSELLGLDGRLHAELHERQLAVELPALRLQRLNPGIPLGPLQLRASYQAAQAAPLAGRLQLWQAEAGLLGGQLAAEPARLDLARPPQRLAVQVRGLELAELLRVYPAEGLSGRGTLDGRLPLRLDAEGLHIVEGRIAARPPGGALQLRSERIRAFARSNPALQLAATALEDFRYDRLESEVDYAPRGQLLLALRLHGQNPALEGGRPVNLAINLEENVPSLLTSLQLSGRVNEAIQRRVQQQLQRRD